MSSPRFGGGGAGGESPNPSRPDVGNRGFTFPAPDTTSVQTHGATSTRFHDAYASSNPPFRPSTSASTYAARGHLPYSDSVDSLDQFQPALDSVSPRGTTTFEGLQSALKGEFAWGTGETDSRFYDEPEEDQTVRRRPDAWAAQDANHRYEDALQAAQAVLGRANGGTGRPASIDMANSGSYDFLRTAPSLTQSQPPSTSSASQATIKAKPERGRTFPAPLLLKADRPFGSGGGGSPANSPVLGQGPFATPAPRKSSVSAANMAAASSGAAFTAPARPWTPTSSASRSNTPTPYQRGHRAQQSSSISYTHSGPDPHHAYSLSSNSELGAKSSLNASPVMQHSGLGLVGGGLSFSTPAGGFYQAQDGDVLPRPQLAVSEGPSASLAPITAQALLLYVLSLRTAPPSQSSISSSSRSGTPQHRSNLSASSSVEPNEGGPLTSPTRRFFPLQNQPLPLDTVDLSHKRIETVPQEVIDELRDEVEKLALGYNLLRELPEGLGMISKLRYLNVRVNLLTAFPAVLCEMPSLEILDISRNKIRKLPSQPGTLLNLKVFSIAKNRVRRLPTYIPAMTHLKVFKIDHNPLEWPPKAITYFPGSERSGDSVTGKGPPNKQEEAEEMQRWLPGLVRWIRENADRRDKVRNSLPPAEPTSDEERGDGVDRSFDSSRTAVGMARTDSRDRALTPTPSSHPAIAPSHAASPVHGELVLPPSNRTSIHGRNASHNVEPNLARSALKAKKSLPDLRQPHADILAEREGGSIPVPSTSDVVASGATAALRRLKGEGAVSRPVLQHSSSARAALPTQTLAATSPTSSSILTTMTTASPTTLRQPQPLKASSVSTKATFRRPMTPNSSSQAGADFASPSPLLQRSADMDRSPSGGFNRNSGAYFRRLSMLPASTISKAVPLVLLEFADAIRGILFSLSQVYTALRQFVVFASQDRLPAPLARLMGSADGAMSLLINALDRFDSLSRRGTPEPRIVEDIFTTCKDNVAMFMKLVAALKPELKALVSTADVRYTRTLLLMLYGSTGEIAKSWNAVTPLLEEMSESGEDPTLATLATSAALNGRSGGSSTGGAAQSGLLRSRSKTRRHAGSFSVEDVQLGAVLPAAPVVTGTSLSSTTTNTMSSTDLTPGHRPSTSSTSDDASSWTNSGGATIKTPRPAKITRSPVMPLGALPMPTMLGVKDMIVNALEQPLTPGGQGLFFGDHTVSDAIPALPAPSRSGSFSAGTRPELPSTSSSSLSTATSAPTPFPTKNSAATSAADETFLDMVDSTTGIAFDVYRMLLDSFDEVAEGRDGEGALTLTRELGPRRTKELTDLCILGNEVTTKLTGSLGRIRGPDRGRRPVKFSAADAKRLGDDAYTFVQTVIRFAKLVKAISLEHGFAPRVREGVGQLTISTREFAKALSNSATSL